MEEISNYICSTEICIKKIRAGLIHTMAELYELVGQSVATSVQRIVRDTFFSSNFYVWKDKIIIYFFDELDAEKMTDYLISKLAYPVERQYIYELVCRIQQRIINKFYRDLDLYKAQQVMEIKILKDNQLLDLKQYIQIKKAYEKAFVRRTNYPHKRIRAN